MKWNKLFSVATLTAATVFATACNNTGNTSNPVISGVTGPTVTLSGTNVVVSMVFNNISIDGGVTIPVPHYTNSTVYVGPDFQSGGMLLTLTVNGADFFNNQNLVLDPQTLPGGRSLPTVNGGSLPAIAILVPQLNNTVLYLGKDVIGFFTPLKGLGLSGAIVSSNFFNTSGTKIGTVSLVGEDANKENSGILLLMSTSLLGLNKAVAASLQ